MQISIEHFDGKYPSFNVILSVADGGDPFITIKGCRIVEGSKGPFVSWPATKNEKTGKYWNHVYAGEAFSEAVLKKAQKQAKPVQPKPQPAKGSGFEDMDDDVPW